MAFNPVIFQTPADAASQALVAAMKADTALSTLFDGDDLRLFLSPTEYKRTIEEAPTKLMTGYASTFVMETARRVGFEFSTTESREEVIRLLRAIALWSRRTKQTVTVRDYHHLEDDAAYALGYTVRLGKITMIEPQGGTVRRFDSVSSTRYGKGFRLVFWEVELREYF